MPKTKPLPLTEKEHLAMIDTYVNTLKYRKDIAEEHGIKDHQFLRILEHYNIPQRILGQRIRKMHCESQEKQIAEDYKRMTGKEVAQKYGVSQSYVVNLGRKYKVFGDKRKPSNIKLRNNDIDYIVEQLREQGRSIKELAREHNVSYSTIYRIVREREAREQPTYI